ncbi:MAG: hypothetical protein IJ256_03615 [Bacteroidaceae bacterium]|nr:hypothetical protein [Bacteroidaceae bacterium]MBQ8116183.1 hypothetical protein [Prevotella sp.]
MNRILSIAILLLTLLTAEEVSAQSYYNEMYPDCNETDYGQGTVVLPCFEICRSQCSSCEGFFDCDEIAEHEKGCYYECNKCNQKMKVIERDKHKCKGDEPEPDPDPKPDNDPKPESDPGKPDNPSGGGPKGIPDQYLPNVTVNGKNKSSFNWWDWTLVYGGGGGGSSSSSNNDNGESVVTPTEEQPLHAAQQSGGKTDSIGYHRCPCMITANAKFYLNDIDNDPKWDELNKLYDGLTEGLKRHLAFPETIQQGNNGTCAAALIQKYLAENYPDKYEECVYELAKNGKYEPWGLEIPLKSNLKAISDYELRRETEDVNNYNLGIDFTADDALMQTAIQNWSDNNNLFRRIHNKITGNAYSVIYDYGDIGGMTVDDRSSFLFNVSPLSIVNNSGKTSYNELAQKLKTYSPDDYTIMAGVDMRYDDKGYYFGDSLSNHALEIKGIEDGHINFWSYGKDGTTVKKDEIIKNLIIMKKTDYAKEEKKDRKSLVCNCPNCTNDGCSKCM